PHSCPRRGQRLQPRATPWDQGQKQRRPERAKDLVLGHIIIINPTHIAHRIPSRISSRTPEIHPETIAFDGAPPDLQCTLAPPATSIVEECRRGTNADRNGFHWSAKV